MNSRLLLLSLLTVMLSTSGCVGLALTASTTAGVTTAQERSVGKAVDDWSIWAQIKHLYLQKDVEQLLGNVHVEVVEARVHLSGTVQHPSDRVEAVKLAWQPDGVKEVINDIEVMAPNTERGGAYLKNIAQDNLITSQLKTKLLFEKNIRSINYNVETNEGIVYLMGVAQNETELENVTEIARRIKGVKRVVSYVLLKNGRERRE